MRIRQLVLAAAASMVLAAANAEASYIYTDIADITGSVFSAGTARLNDSGTVVFSTRTPAVGGELNTIYIGNGGALTLVDQAQSNIAAPVRGLGFPDIANDGSVLYSTIDDNASGNRRLVRWSGGSQTVVFDLNSQPDFVGAIPDTAISNDGSALAFTVNLAGGGRGAFSGDGTPNGPFTPIATPGTGFPAVNLRVSVNNGGEVAFLSGGSVGGAILKGDGSGAPTLIVDGSTNVATGESIGYVGALPAINNNGDVGFVALFDGFADGGYFIGNGGALTTVLRFSDLSRNVVNISEGDLNDQGVMAFFMAFDDGSEGIYLGPDLINDKVIETGDALFGSTVTGVDFVRGLNNNNAVAFGVELADGTLHIVRADQVLQTAVSEPGSLWLLVAGTGGFAAACRRRRSARRV